MVSLVFLIGFSSSTFPGYLLSHLNSRTLSGLNRMHLTLLYLEPDRPTVTKVADTGVMGRLLDVRDVVAAPFAGSRAPKVSFLLVRGDVVLI